jgi:hypothetical protein
MTEIEQSRAAELLARQDPITVEIDDDGLTLRQQNGLGGEAAIYIARANISAFLEALLDLTPHRFFGMPDAPPIEGVRPSAAPEVKDQKAADRARRYRKNKRAKRDTSCMDRDAGRDAHHDAPPLQPEERLL